MGILSGLSAITIMLGVLVGVISLIALIIMKLMKKEIKTPAILTGSAFGAALLGVGLLFVATIVQMMNEPIATEGSPTEATTEATTEGVAEETEDDTSSSDPSATIDTSKYEREEEEDEVDELIAEADERIEQREKEEQEALENRPDTSDRDNYRNDIDVRDIERNPDEYMNELIVFEGKIIQVIEEDDMSAYRVAVNDDYDRIVLVSTLSSSLDERLLEDDYVTVYGEFTDLLTYETVMGGARTVPSFVAMGENIILQ